MPTSNITFEEGEGIDLGSHGDHDFVFEEGVEVPDTGVSTLVFEEGVGLGSSGVIIDDWERGNTNPYTLMDAGNGINDFNASTVRPYEGTYSLNSYDSNNASIYSLPGDGLNYYPVRGDIVEAYVYLNNGYEGAEFGVAAQNIPSSSDGENHYEFGVKANGSESNPSGGVHFSKRKNGSWDNNNGDSPLRTGPDAPTGEWIRLEFTWGDPTLSFTAYLQDSNGDFTDELGSLSFDDTEWDSGGVHWSSSQSSGNPTDTYSDFARKIGTV